MTGTNFTQGPWFLINECCVGGPIEPGFEDSGYGVAHCGMRARTKDEAHANAHLISAAPDLYAALNSVRDLVACEVGYGEGIFSDADLSRIDAALAKARGEAA